MIQIFARKLADLPGGSPERLKGRTQMKLNSSRGIVTKLICCMALVVVTSVFCFSQNPPTSGAMLSIDGTPNTASANVHVKIYDSQIHSGNVQVVPTGGGTPPCASADQIPTDAYVLQGGAPTGCDPGDAFEVTDNNSISNTHQDFGQKDLSGFHIETHYKMNTAVSISGVTQKIGNDSTYAYTLTSGPDLVAGETIVVTGFTTDTGNNGTFVINSVVSGTSFTVTNANGVADSETASGAVTWCNTSGSICAAPDTGFITVTNNTGSSFSGTISLTGTSPTAGGFCPAGGIASDSFTGTLANSTGSRTLALSTDSSNCGGFNQPQSFQATAGQKSTISFGKDDYIFTPLNSASGDTFSILPVPVPAGPLGQTGVFGPFHCPGPNCTFQSGAFGTESPIDSSPLRFSATNFPTLACVPYADFSAPGNPVCVELHEDCTNGGDSCADAGNILYTVQNDYNIDANSLPTGVGGPAFIGKHVVNCPSTAFDTNIFASYKAPLPTFDPLKGSGQGTTSCWVIAFDPSAAAVTTDNSVASFTGFAGLLTPNSLNRVNIGSAVPLNFTFPTAGLHLCSTVNNTGSTCNGGASKPWVAFGTLSIDCTSKAFAPTSTEKTAAAGGSNLQTISTSTTPPFTSYRFNWKIPKAGTLGAPTPGSCVVMVAQFSGGLVVFPDYFQYK